MKNKFILLIIIILFVLESIYLALYIAYDLAGYLSSIILFSSALLLNSIILCYIYLSVLIPLNTICLYVSKMVSSDRDLPILPDSQTFLSLCEDLALLNEELRKAKYNEYQLNQKISNALGELNSGIKTSVSSIQEASKLLRAQSQSTPQRIHAELISTKSDYMQSLVSTLITTFATDNIKKHAVNIEHHQGVSIYEIINSVDYDKKIEFAGVIPDCTLCYDSEILWQVFENIFHNVNKYAKTKITVYPDLDDHFLHITIRDYGKGVAPEDITHVFEKHYQGKNSAGKSGSGLGLYVSLNYMASMNGFISCENYRDGFGVTISILRNNECVQLKFTDE